MSEQMVALDSQVLVFAERRVGTSAQKQRAQWLFQYLDSIDARVLVPSVVLSEYLVPIADEKRPGVVAALSARFIIAPFDVRCAELAARLFRDGLAERAAEQPLSRACLRADCLIVATAAVHGASVFYSHDGQCRKLAARLPGMVARDMPESPQGLFSAD